MTIGDAIAWVATVAGFCFYVWLVQHAKFRAEEMKIERAEREARQGNNLKP